MRDSEAERYSLGTSITLTLDEVSGGRLPNHFLCAAATKSSFFIKVSRSLTLAASGKFLAYVKE